MTHEWPIRYVPGVGDAGRRLAQLREVLNLVQEVGGCQASSDAALDENARLSSAYANALPVVQKRFDALADQTEAWAALAVEALTKGDDGNAPKAATTALAEELSLALDQLAAILKTNYSAAAPLPSATLSPGYRAAGTGSGSHSP
jgi:hypothetical protein